MPIQQPVDRLRRHGLAQLLLVGPLNLRHSQHAAGLGALYERQQKLLLLLRGEVLVASAAAATQIEDRVAFLGPARVQGMHSRR